MTLLFQVYARGGARGVERKDVTSELSKSWLGYVLSRVKLRRRNIARWEFECARVSNIL